MENIGHLGNISPLEKELMMMKQDPEAICTLYHFLSVQPQGPPKYHESFTNLRSYFITTMAKRRNVLVQDALTTIGIFFKGSSPTFPVKWNRFAILVKKLGGNTLESSDGVFANMAAVDQYISLKFFYTIECLKDFACGSATYWVGFSLWV